MSQKGKYHILHDYKVSMKLKSFVTDNWNVDNFHQKHHKIAIIWHIYRKMIKISWKENTTNKEVLNVFRMADEHLYIIQTIQKRSCKNDCVFWPWWSWRINVHRLLLEGQLEGKMTSGRPRTEWMTNIKEWTGMRYGWQDREPWRIVTADLLEEDEWMNEWMMTVLLTPI